MVVQAIFPRCPLGFNSKQILHVRQYLLVSDSKSCPSVSRLCVSNENRPTDEFSSIAKASCSIHWIVCFD